MSYKAKGFIFNVAPLQHGHHRSKVTVDPIDIGLLPEEFEQIEVEIDADIRKDKTADSVLIRLATSAKAHLVCDRTLVPFDRVVEGDYVVFFTNDTEAGQLEDDVRPLPSHQQLDLMDAVRDTILLSVPIRKIAHETEEEEITLVFGNDPDEDTTTDSRWDALKNIKFEDDE